MANKIIQWNSEGVKQIETNWFLLIAANICL